MEPTPEDESTALADATIVAIMLVGVAMNLFVLWDQNKDRPEVLVMRQRVGSWWRQRRERARELCRMEIAVVQEATRVVEGT